MSRAAMIKLAKKAWNAKLLKERATAECDDIAHDLITAFEQDGTNTITFQADDCLVTGTLVKSEKASISEAGMAYIKSHKNLHNRIFPEQVIPEQRVRALNDDALAQCIAEGLLDPSYITIGPARKPHVRWTTKVDSSAKPIDDLVVGSGMHNINKKAPKHKRV